MRVLARLFLRPGGYCMGYTEIYVHQIGPDQEGFFRFFEKEILPEFG